METTNGNPARSATIPDYLASIGLSTLALVAANAGLILIYLIFDLELFQLVVVFWIECLWIGVFSALKLLVASVAGSPYENRYVDFSRGGALLFSLFAIGFIAAEFLFVFVIVGFALSLAFDAFVGDAKDFLFANLGLMFGGSLLFLGSHAISFVANFLIGGEYKSARFLPLLLLPFTRCFALFAAIVLAVIVAKIVPGLSNATGFAFVLIALKLAWDLRLHRKERRRLASARKEDPSSPERTKRSSLSEPHQPRVPGPETAVAGAARSMINMHTVLKIMIGVQLFMGAWFMLRYLVAGREDWNVLAILFYTYAVHAVFFVVAALTAWVSREHRKKAWIVMGLPIAFFVAPVTLRALRGPDPFTYGEIGAVLLAIAVAGTVYAIMRPGRPGPLLPASFRHSRFVNWSVLIAVVLSWLVPIAFVALIVLDGSTGGRGGANSGLGVYYLLLAGGIAGSIIGIASLIAMTWSLICLRSSTAGDRRGLNVAQAVVASPGLLLGAGTLVLIVRGLGS